MSFESQSKEQLIKEIKEAAKATANDSLSDAICFAKMKALVDSTVLGISVFSVLGIMLVMDLVFITWYSIGISVMAICIILIVGYHFLKKDNILNFKEEMIDRILKIEDTI